MKTIVFNQMRRSRWLCLFPAVVCSLLAGCSALNIGENQYGCSGLPKGVQCWSARKVYDATHHGQLPQPEREASARRSVAVAVSTDQTAYRRGRSVVNAAVPALASVTGPTPLRTPSRVMRIWIAPWIDARGDLMWPSVVYTEIESRRWQIGQPAVQPAPMLRPLAPARSPVHSTSDSKASVGGHPR